MPAQKQGHASPRKLSPAPPAAHSFIMPLLHAAAALAQTGTPSPAQALHAQTHTCATLLLRRGPRAIKNTVGRYMLVPRAPRQQAACRRVIARPHLRYARSASLCGYRHRRPTTASHVSLTDGKTAAT